LHSTIILEWPWRTLVKFYIYNQFKVPIMQHIMYRYCL
jgi:hypothetical protein